MSINSSKNQKDEKSKLSLWPSDRESAQNDEILSPSPGIKPKGRKMASKNLKLAASLKQMESKESKVSL